MIRGRRSFEDRSRARLLDLWRGDDDFGEPVGCVATTYTFKADFFEEQCLSCFLRMDSDAAEDQRSYVLEHETKLSQAFACVLVDQSHVSGPRSLRWHQIPVRVPGAIQHAKVSVLQWQQCVRVLIGSANLTAHGYRNNYEHIAVLDFLPDGSLPLSLLSDVVAFVREVQRFGVGSEQEQGPSVELTRFLDGIDTAVRGWTDAGWPRGEPKCRLAPVGPGATSLIQKMAEAWTGPPANGAAILSPFYNTGSDARRMLNAVEEQLLISRGERQICFDAPGRRAAEGVIEIDLPESLRRPSRPAVSHRFFWVPDRESEDKDCERRPLHAKSIWLGRDRHVLISVGSSNFTLAGTGVAGAPNIEANLIYDIPDSESEFGKLCVAATPAAIEVDPDKEKVRFLVDDQDEDSAENVELQALPMELGAALFDAGRNMLRLEILGPSPGPEGLVAFAGEERVLDAQALREGAFPRTIEYSWRPPRAPSHLDVSWENAGVRHRAIWVVNAADTALLAPPDELKQLTLDELLEVLTSARPYHEVLARILKARDKKATTPAAGKDLDPHKRVDTSKYLLRRMKRVAVALEGLRARLQRPVFSREALGWRLRGPLGPIAVSQRLAEEEKEGAGFMIAEVALCLRDVQFCPAGGLTREAVQKEVGAVLVELADLARRYPAPPNLAAYVEESFQEVLR